MLYTTNLKRGDDASTVYWRALAGLRDDPITSMFTLTVHKGLAKALYEGLATADHKAGFSNSALRPFIQSVITASSLSILSPEAQNHMVNVIYRSFIVED